MSSAAVSHQLLTCRVHGSTITLHGDLDLSSAKRLRKTFAGIPAPEIIDMSEVTSVTSAALIEFMTLAKSAGQSKVVLLRPQPTVGRLFRVLGLDRIFALVDRVEPG